MLDVIILDIIWSWYDGYYIVLVFRFVQTLTEFSKPLKCLLSESPEFELQKVSVLNPQIEICRGELNFMTKDIIFPNHIHASIHTLHFGIICIE